MLTTSGELGNDSSMTIEEKAEVEAITKKKEEDPADEDAEDGGRSG